MNLSAPPPHAWWDGSRWTTLDGRFWWDGRQWLPRRLAQSVPPPPPPRLSGGPVPGWNPSATVGPLHPRRNVSLAVLVAAVGLTILAFASGFVSIERHDNLGGWTVTVGGYSCWIAPGGDTSKSYCGRDSGFYHLPVPSDGTGFGSGPQ